MYLVACNVLDSMTVTTVTCVEHEWTHTKVRWLRLHFKRLSQVQNYVSKTPMNSLKLLSLPTGEDYDTDESPIDAPLYFPKKKTGISAKSMMDRGFKGRCREGQHVTAYRYMCTCICRHGHIHVCMSGASTEYHI